MNDNATLNSASFDASDKALKTRGAATIEDIAQAVGVSRTTVSKAFTGYGRISGKTRETVMRVAEELGYQPNVHAQRLTNGHCRNMIGLFTRGLDFGVGARKLQTVQHLLSAQGFDVPVYAYIEANEVIADELKLLRSLCLQRPRAIIWGTGVMAAVAVEELQRYQDFGGIVVAYDHATVLLCDHVVFDRLDNTYQAARHLLDLGHRKIGFYNVHSIDSVRLQGFTKALREFGVELRRDWVFAGGRDEEGGAYLAQLYLKLPRRDRPTALCVVNDASAASFVAEVGRHGVRVPEDVSVVGHDDSPIARYSPLRITTVSQPVETIAQHVVDLLCHRVTNAHPGAPRAVTVKGSLIIRESAIPIGGARTS